jgi:predicted phosphohydrolase
MNRRGFQYISDLHLERLVSGKFPRIAKHADTLLLCGDIGNVYKSNYKSFLNYTSNEFDKVFLITGNHEYYHRDMKKVFDVDNKINDITSNFSNVHFLNQDCYQDKNYKILGTTLWADGFKYYMQEPNQHLKDFGEFVHERHLSDVNWLSNNIYIEPRKEVIVMTHYLPTYKLISPQFMHYNNLDRFANNLDFLIRSPVKYWLCGHSHCKFETKINNITCGINSFTLAKK